METTEGILLKVAPYGETQTIVNIFTLREGFMAMITPENKNKYRVPYAVMQECEVEFLRNERGGLHRMRNIVPRDRASKLHFDIERAGYARLWGYMLSPLLREQGADPDLYGYINKAIDVLESYDKSYINLTLLFFWRLTTLFGIKPHVDGYKQGYLFHIERGEFVSAYDGGTGYPLTGPNVAEAIYKFMVMEIDRVGNFKISFKSFEIILETLLLYFERHFAVRFDREALVVIKEILNT